MYILGCQPGPPKKVGYTANDDEERISKSAADRDTVTLGRVAALSRTMVGTTKP